MFGMPARGLVAAAGLLLVYGYVAHWFPNAAVRSGSAANRVTDLQRARTADAFAAVLRRWSATNEKAVGIVKWENIIALDSSFPAVYGVTFALLYALSTGRKTPGRRDLLLFAVPLAAAACDYVENALQLYSLRGIDTGEHVKDAITKGSISGAAVFGQWLAATVKYVLLAVTAGATVATLVVRGKRAYWRR